MRASIVVRGYSTEPLLTSCVPNLHLNHVPVYRYAPNFLRKNYEIYAYCTKEVLIELVVRVAK